jgi:hypothetical protein
MHFVDTAAYQPNGVSYRHNFFTLSTFDESIFYQYFEELFCMATCILWTQEPIYLLVQVTALSFLQYLP